MLKSENKTLLIIQIKDFNFIFRAVVNPENIYKSESAYSCDKMTNRAYTCMTLKKLSYNHEISSKSSVLQGTSGRSVEGR